MEVLALHRVRRRESLGLTWQPWRAPAATPPPATSQWASPADVTAFANGMARQEGSTPEGVAWFMSEG